MSVRGRYAPSPTGEIHLGNASSALLAWLSIRSRRGQFVMRNEDLDGQRVLPGLADRILRDLEWFGLDWDEGPYVQSQRTPRYVDAFERLRVAGYVYPCFCTRKEVAAAASAPQEPGELRRYGGTCLGLDPGESARRVAAGERHAFRFRVDPGSATSFDDLVHGAWSASRPPADFVVFRSDGVPAYQLAVVVDDAEMRIDEVVRGADLLPSTLCQLLLYRALGYEAPVFGHVPLLVGPDGARLSKRHRGITLRELRDDGWTAERLIGRLAQALQLRPTPEPISAAELARGFSLRDLRPQPEGILIDFG